MTSSAQGELRSQGWRDKRTALWHIFQRREEGGHTRGTTRSDGCNVCFSRAGRWAGERAGHFRRGTSCTSSLLREKEQDGYERDHGASTPIREVGKDK